MTRPLATLSPHAAEFLQSVHEGLCDLPLEDQTDLLAQVEHRLRDLDSDQDPEAIHDHLGPAPVLVRELRAAAGFPPPSRTTRPSSATSELIRDALNHRLLRPVVSYLASLRPAWWAPRGYLLLSLALAALTGGSGFRLHTLGYYTAASREPGPIHHSALWLLIPIAAVIASIVLGLLRSRLTRPAQLFVIALNIAAVISLLAYPTWWMAPAFGYYTGLVS